MAEINVTINDDTGEITYEVNGMSGPECEILTRELEQETGTVVKRSKLPEFYQKSEQKQKQGR